MSSTKYTILTYLFAVTGGIFGLHHLYLGRTQHALLWFTTFGGFGIGILYEILFSIKTYVREANHDKALFEQYQEKRLQQKSPAFQLTRFSGQYLTGLFYGFITFYAFPDTWLNGKLSKLIMIVCTTFAISIGVQICGTLGPRHCPYRWSLIGAFLGALFSMWRGNNPISFSVVSFFCCLVFQWKVEWNSEFFSGKVDFSSKKGEKHVHRRRHFVKRCLILGLGASIFISLVTCAIYQNLQVEINGERVKIKDVLSEFFKSPQYAQLTQHLSNVAKELWAFYLQYGFKGMWTQIWTSLDLESDKKAFETLELDPKSSQKEIEAQCRSLSRKWHPDRYRDPAEKEKAESTFMNIQQACNRLSDDRKRRQIINAQKRENPK